MKAESTARPSMRPIHFPVIFPAFATVELPWNRDADVKLVNLARSQKKGERKHREASKENWEIRYRKERSYIKHVPASERS